MFWVPSLQRISRKAFKFFHHVIDHANYERVVGEAWNCDAVTGSNQFKVARSLKMMKKHIRDLNKTAYNGITNRVKEEASKLARLQDEILTNPTAEIAREELLVRQCLMTLIAAQEKYYNSAIALIPKTAEASKLGDFRPISCCNLMYKVISKIIANRLKPILVGYISPNQAAFLKGRNLGENVLLASELIRKYERVNCSVSSMMKIDRLLIRFVGILC